MKKSTRICLLVIVLIIATFLRFYHFTNTPPGLYPDEAMDGNNAVEVAQTGHFQVFYVEDNGREGLYVNILAVILKAFPVYEPWVVRLPAAVAGVLTVWGLYLLVAELFGDGPGLLAAFLLATSFWHINFSRIGFRAILAPLLLTWAFYFLIKAFRSVKPRLALFYSVAAGFIYALGFYTYIAYRVTPLLFLLFIPFFKKYPGFWKRVTTFIAITFVVAAPIGWYFLKNPSDFFGRTAEISVTNSSSPVAVFVVNVVKTLLMLNFHGDSNWRQNISGAPELFWPVGILFLIGIVLAAWSLIKSWRNKTMHDDSRNMLPAFPLLAMFLWFILAIFPAAASNEGIPHALRSILMIPPIMTFAALGGIWSYNLIKDHWNKMLAKTLAVVLLLFIGVFGYVNYFIVWAQNPNVPGAFNADYVQTGQQINLLPASTPKYIVVTAGGVLARGIPVPAQTVMFITDSFTVKDQEAHNIHYLLPDQTSQIPSTTPSGDIFYIN